MEKIQVKQEILKDRQAKLEGLIKKRNEADTPKKLQRRTCVFIIINNLKEQLTGVTYNEESLYKLLSRWDQSLANGEKIPIQGYDSARNNSISYFSDWVKVEFIPYYVTKRKIKGYRTRLSSNPRAIDEAAVKQYKKTSHSMYDEGDDD